MSVLASVLLYLIQYDKNYCETFYDGTELAMAFMVHRHGDRTPLLKTLKFSNEPEVLEKLIQPYGYGQLTKAGIKRGYELGKFIRRRYDDYLSPSYNLSEIYIRSTDSTRAKMTVLAAMAAVYPPNEQRWHEELNWTPIPYTTVPIKDDPNMPVLNCPTFKKFIDRIVYSRAGEEMMSAYSGLLKELVGLGIDLTDSPAAIFMLYDLYVAQMSLGLPLTPALQKLLPRIEEASGKAWDMAFGNEKILPLGAGVLLKEFLDEAELAMSRKLTQKIRILSGHDANVYPMLAITKATPRPSTIRYGALYSLELRRVTRTGKYVVLPVFLGSPEEKEEYLQLEGCDDIFCDFEQFKNITSKYAIDETEYRRLCEFDPNAKIDTSTVD